MVLEAGGWKWSGVSPPCSKEAQAPLFELRGQPGLTLSWLEDLPSYFRVQGWLSPTQLVGLATDAVVVVDAASGKSTLGGTSRRFPKAAPGPANGRCWPGPGLVVSR